VGRVEQVLLEQLGARVLCELAQLPWLEEV
jgi:hypothetical protein